MHCIRSRTCDRFASPTGMGRWCSTSGANGLPVAQGVVRWFDLNAGSGMIARDGTGEEVFFHFTALPGQGYRTLRAGTPVKFELVESSTGLSARNIQMKSMP